MTIHSGSLQANFVDIHQRQIYFAEIIWQQGIIQNITRLGAEAPENHYLLPGLIDAHVHIESSMLTPVEFSRLAVRHGTVASVSDPHEIANVLGLDGIDFMVQNATRTPFKICFGAPSCVPATLFETAGARLATEQLEILLRNRQVGYVSEMMNYPGVLAHDGEVMAKLALARRYAVPVDGHAPQVSAEQAKAYAQSGISTDHECTTLAEAQAKIAAGMKILIREGSAARNFDALHDLISLHPDQVMFCSDDKHPDDLLLGHINQFVTRALAKGHDLFDVLKCACLNPIEHYQLPVGQLRIGDPMDALEVSDLTTLTPLHTWISGQCVASHGHSLINSIDTTPCNRFNARPVQPTDFKIPAKHTQIRVIKAFDGELVTEAWQTEACIQDQHIVADSKRDILWLTVVNRYQPSQPALAFIKGFGLKQGALASSIAHDSHNIIAVGTDVESICLAVNSIIETQGGIASATRDHVELLPLPIAGLMSDGDCDLVAARYAELNNLAREKLGSTLRAPFMTLSFMALLVIPELKLSDRGLFDSRTFQFTSLPV